ncbi:MULTISPECIES: DUF7426 family protein [unclassified Streptomyces]|uniref:DUF7426 family protein n=1 Tax=unclassified Streptomyces TaxID=2593676 RepID=UPI0006B06D0B|nr:MULTISPECIES: hypothetical protein [unclassified Streptomyces]KOX16574.1 hypothetical protein ADL06_33280 [Streptomyces sp. NRRL F-6491]KOX36098.1 hypothetical protein ADL08_33460 [Streptomyces sp. NRRL F-6492]
MAFEALDELLVESLTLPIGGRHYAVPAPSAEVGLRTQALVHAAAVAADGGRADETVLSDAAERDHFRDVLGTAYDEMLADGVSWPALKHAALTCMVWIAQDKVAAERFWNSGGDPNRLAPNRAARRSGGANSTRNPGSGSGTSTRPEPGRGKRKGGKRRK